MLKILRNKKTAKRVWIILAVIIVPAFALWGIGGAVRSQKESGYAGKIFGRNISVLEFKDALDAVRIQAIIQFGEDFSEMRKYLNLENEAWERIILLEEAKKRKITASNQEVIELIESYPFFQRKGQFNNRIYAEMIQYAFRTQPRIFEEQSRQTIILSKLYKQVTDNIRVNDEEIKDGYSKANEQISISYIVSAPSDFVKNLKPSLQELKDYFADNSIKFKQPLSFNLEYIVLDSLQRTKDALAKLNKNADLAKLAKELGLSVKETGLFSQIDPIPGIGWSPEVFTLISKLKIGQFSPPIHTDKYFYILKLKEKKEPFIPNFEEIKDKIKDAYLKEKSTELAKLKIDEALKNLRDLNDFKKTAKKTGLKSDTTALFKFGSYIEGIGASDNFWVAAQHLKGNEFSDIISMPSGFYIIKLKSKSPLDQKKFQNEKVDFAQNLLQQKRREFFSKFTEELKRNTQ